MWAFTLPTKMTQNTHVLPRSGKLRWQGEMIDLSLRLSWFCGVVVESKVQTLHHFCAIRNETARIIQSALHSLSVKWQPCCQWQLNCIDWTTKAKIGHWFLPVIFFPPSLNHHDVNDSGGQKELSVLFHVSISVLAAFLSFRNPEAHR